jgi:hypothetical protein
MRRGKILGIGTMGAAVITAVALLASVSSSSGAYFSATRSGTITGSGATITETTSGGGGTDSADLVYTNMLPNVAQTVTVNYGNTGSVPADAWLVFPNVTALSALNNLGTYGKIQIDSNTTDVFDSQNLNDHPSCPPGAGPAPVCKALPAQILLATHVVPGYGGSVSFSFAYGAKLTTQGGAFNSWPQTTAGNVQTTVVASDGSGTGLPYEIVLEQEGQTPGVVPATN